MAQVPAKPKKPAAAPPSAAAPPQNFLSPFTPDAAVSPEAHVDRVKLAQLERETDALNVAVRAFQLLLDRAKRSRDVSGQPASFQYTLWCMVVLVIVVTVVGVLLLNIAAKRQRDKLTSTTEVKHGQHDMADNELRLAVESDRFDQEATGPPAGTLGEDGTWADPDDNSAEQTTEEEVDAATTTVRP
ncbi:uncharacterized protein LOC119454147 [Dermacentor silvarum]|uniref:uncharacterized protein LOC119454147 n=1 Tax=Dermacentor silvarum TaxID=543639 RepID=UPI00210089FD|nr:uncharacterized protein LOC119454147 [Dermacentor silvarum]